MPRYSARRRRAAGGTRPGSARPTCRGRPLSADCPGVGIEPALLASCWNGPLCHLRPARAFLRPRTCPKRGVFHSQGGELGYRVADLQPLFREHFARHGAFRFLPGHAIDGPAPARANGRTTFCTAKAAANAEVERSAPRPDEPGGFEFQCGLRPGRAPTRHC